MGDVQESYGGSRNGVILPDLAKCVWVLLKDRAACFRAEAEMSILVGPKGWEVRLAGKAAIHAIVVS